MRNVSGVPHAAPLPPWFVFCLLFSFSLLTAPFSHTGGTPSCSQMLGGLPFSSCCALLTNTRHDTTVSLFVFFSSFFFSHSLTDPPLTCIPPSHPSRPCHVAPPTCRPVTSTLSHHHLASPLAPSSCIASPSLHIASLGQLPRASPCCVVFSLCAVLL